MPSLPDLKKLLQYNNESLIHYYNKYYATNKLKGETALAELLKYFWLSVKHEADKAHHPEDNNLSFICSLHNRMHDIDDMWHTFLLFTKDYTQFCQNYFGRYLHHSPVDHDEQADVEVQEIELARFLAYTYEHLGETTVKTWFADFFTDAH